MSPVRFILTTSVVLALIVTLTATPTGDAHPAPDATITHTGEDRWCTIPLDGTETVVQWAQWSDGGRSEVSTTTPAARCTVF